MKKVFLVCLFVILPIVLFGTIAVAVVIKSGNKNAYATSLDSTLDNLTMEVGDSYTFSKNEFIIQPVDCTQNVVINTNDCNVVDVNSTSGKIVAKNLGTAVITAKIKSSETENCSTQIVIYVVKDSISADQKAHQTKQYTFSYADSFKKIEFRYEDESKDFKDASSGKILSYNVLSGGDVATIEVDCNCLTLIFNKCGFIKIEVCTKYVVYTLKINIE